MPASYPVYLDSAKVTFINYSCQLNVLLKWQCFHLRECWKWRLLCHYFLIYWHFLQHWFWSFTFMALAVMCNNIFATVLK